MYYCIYITWLKRVVFIKDVVDRKALDYFILDHHSVSHDVGTTIEQCTIMHYDINKDSSN